ncbi:hypothetical protein RQP46_009924 [Phenoliferia psychrophenolica]
MMALSKKAEGKRRELVPDPLSDVEEEDERELSDNEDGFGGEDGGPADVEDSGGESDFSGESDIEDLLEDVEVEMDDFEPSTAEKLKKLPSKERTALLLKTLVETGEITDAFELLTRGRKESGIDDRDWRKGVVRPSSFTFVDRTSEHDAEYDETSGELRDTYETIPIVPGIGLDRAPKPTTFSENTTVAASKNSKSNAVSENWQYHPLNDSRSIINTHAKTARFFAAKAGIHAGHSINVNDFFIHKSSRDRKDVRLLTVANPVLASVPVELMPSVLEISKRRSSERISHALDHYSLDHFVAKVNNEIAKTCIRKLCEEKGLVIYERSVAFETPSLGFAGIKKSSLSVEVWDVCSANKVLRSTFIFSGHPLAYAYNPIKEIGFREAYVTDCLQNALVWAATGAEPPPESRSIHAHDAAPNTLVRVDAQARPFETIMQQVIAGMRGVEVRGMDVTASDPKGPPTGKVKFQDWPLLAQMYVLNEGLYRGTPPSTTTPCEPAVWSETKRVKYRESSKSSRGSWMTRLQVACSIKAERQHAKKTDEQKAETKRRQAATVAAKGGKAFQSAAAKLGHERINSHPNAPTIKLEKNAKQKATRQGKHYLYTLDGYVPGQNSIIATLISKTHAPLPPYADSDAFGLYSDGTFFMDGYIWHKTKQTYSTGKKKVSTTDSDAEDFKPKQSMLWYCSVHEMIVHRAEIKSEMLPVGKAHKVPSLPVLITSSSSVTDGLKCTLCSTRIVPKATEFEKDEAKLPGSNHATFKRLQYEQVTRMGQKLRCGPVHVTGGIGSYKANNNFTPGIFDPPDFAALPPVQLLLAKLPKVITATSSSSATGPVAGPSTAAADSTKVKKAPKAPLPSSTATSASSAPTVPASRATSSRAAPTAPLPANASDAGTALTTTITSQGKGKGVIASAASVKVKTGEDGGLIAPKAGQSKKAPSTALSRTNPSSSSSTSTASSSSHAPKPKSNAPLAESVSLAAPSSAHSAAPHLSRTSGSSSASAEPPAVQHVTTSEFNSNSSNSSSSRSTFPSERAPVGAGSQSVQRTASTSGGIVSKRKGLNPGRLHEAAPPRSSSASRPTPSRPQSSASSAPAIPSPNPSISLHLNSSTNPKGKASTSASSSSSSSARPSANGHSTTTSHHRNPQSNHTLPSIPSRLASSSNSNTSQKRKVVAPDAESTATPSGSVVANDDSARKRTKHTSVVAKIPPVSTSTTSQESSIIHALAKSNNSNNASSASTATPAHSASFASEASAKRPLGESGNRTEEGGEEPTEKRRRLESGMGSGAGRAGASAVAKEENSIAIKPVSTIDHQLDVEFDEFDDEFAAEDESEIRRIAIEAELSETRRRDQQNWRVFQDGINDWVREAKPKVWDNPPKVPVVTSQTRQALLAIYNSQSRKMDLMLEKSALNGVDARVAQGDVKADFCEFEKSIAKKWNFGDVKIMTVARLRTQIALAKEEAAERVAK